MTPFFVSYTILQLHSQHVPHHHRPQGLRVPHPTSISNLVRPHTNVFAPPSYVLATATLSTLVASYHTLMVGPYRRAAKVPYPNAYASAAECKESKEKYLFNCAQRSHANFLEHQPQMLVGLLIGGLKCMWFAYPFVLLLSWEGEKAENWGEGEGG